MKDTIILLEKIGSLERDIIHQGNKYDRLIENGVPKFKAKMMYGAVRMFGGFAWNKPLK